MNPPDLRALFGSRYRIAYDPAASDEPGGRKDPWLYIIPCRKGHIYPHSSDRLALWWESKARLDRQCPALTMHLDGDDEKVYLFRPEDFPAVAKVARPARKRKGRPLTAEERRKAVTRLRQHWFPQKSHST